MPLFANFALILVIAHSVNGFADNESFKLKIQQSKLTDTIIKEDPAYYVNIEEQVTDEDSSALVQLAEAYFDGGHYQQAIWTLWRAKEWTLADQLIGRLETVLLTATVDHGAGIRGGRFDTVARIYFHASSNVMSAAEKESQGTDGFHPEALAYALDRLLRLGIVPVTVLKPNDGGGYSTRQMFVYGEKAPFGFYKEEKGQYKDAPERLHLFDFLSQNGDRHIGNWLIGYGGNEMAIDNDMINTAAQSEHIGAMLSKWDRELTRKDLIERINELKPEDFYKALGSYAPTKIIDGIVQRFLQVQASIAAKASKSRCPGVLK